MAGRRPTHNLKIKARSGCRESDSAVVGGAWLNADGSMSIQLNVGVVLRWNDDVAITAFARSPDDGTRLNARSLNEEDGK
jgi:hypothetical protein